MGSEMCIRDRYGATIQDLAASGHNWCYYDENFRFLRQSQATSLPWGTIHWELWLKSQINTKKPISAPGVSKTLDVPRGYCFKFHRGGHCSGRSFKHSCFKCGGPHRAINCYFRAFSKRNNTHFPNQRSNKVPGSQIILQTTSAGAPSTFEIFSSAVEWIAREKLHTDHILHLLDDFLIVSSSHDLCKQRLDLFLMLCHYLGIPMAPEKTIGPSSTISLAGIELD